MAQLNLTMLGGVAALFSGAGSRPGGTGTGNVGAGAGGVGAGGFPPTSFNYSVLHGPGHVPLPGGGTGNHSLLHFPPPDYSKQFGNVSGGATNAAVAVAAAVGGLLDGAYDLAANLTPCSLANDTSAGAVVGLACNFSLLDNASAAAATTNATHTARQSPYSTIQLIVLAFLAGTTCITTIVGNLIVILSFIIERTIRQPTNYFIASLAVSDLLIGTFSMPFYTVYLLTGKYWPLGEVLCDLWLSVDYTVCLTSIYTVFCITIDRFCSVKIPAKYRAWRTDTKVTGVIALTWVIPILVFFTSIFGWQYFVGKRSVPVGMCYVQYMEDALFNCVLQLGYFWVTLTVMCVLYTGIYKVALDLQRKSEAKQKKMTSLVSMAGQTMTKIGIGMSKHQKLDGKSLFERSDQGSTKPDSAPKTLEPGHSTTSFNCKQEKDEDRSSSPAFPSDTDQSSQSPKHNKPLKSEGNNNNKGRNRKRQGKVKNADKKSRRRDLSAEEPGLNSLSAVGSPGLANSAYTETMENNNSPAPPIVGNSLSNATRPFDVKRGSVGNHSLVRSPATSPISALSGGGGGGGSCGGGGGLGGGGGGVGGGGGGVVVSLPHNSVAPLPPAAPLTVDSVEAANIMVNPVMTSQGSQEEPASPSSMENMPSDSPPPYPALFNEGGTPGLSEGEFSFPPPPQGSAAPYYGSDAGSGVVSMRSGGGGGASGTTSPCSGRGVEGGRGSFTGSHHTMPDCIPSITTSTNSNSNPPVAIPAVAVVSRVSPPPPTASTPMIMSNSATDPEVAGRAITTPPEFISGLKYIDQDSLKSPLSTDNIRFLSETAPAPPKERDSLVVEEPDSPVWKRRSLVERETRGSTNGAALAGNLVTTSYSSPAVAGHPTSGLYHNNGTRNGSFGSAGSGGSDGCCGDDSNAKSSPSVQKDSTTANHDSSAATNNSSGLRATPGPPGAHIQVESRQGDISKTVSRLAKPDEIQPLNADDGSHSRSHGHAYISSGGGGSGKRGKGKAGSPLRGLIKSVGSRKFKRKKETKQQKSKSENRARKALRVITIILGAFVLCWTPWHILSMIIGFCPDDSGCVEPTLYDISYWLCYLNSPINPLCYAFANQQFKKTFIRIIRLDWHRT